MRPSIKRAIAVFLLMSIAFMSAIFALQGALLGSIIEAYSLRSSNQGLATTATFAGGFVALLSAIVLQSYLSKRTLLKLAIALCTVCLVLLWIVPNYNLFIAVWFLVGYGTGWMDALLSACMADLYQGRAGTRMMCILHTFFGISSVLSPVGYQALLDRGVAWKQIYLYVALAGAALLACSLIARLASRQFKSPRPVSGGREDRFLRVMRKGVSVPLILAMFFHGLFISGLNTWINRFSETVAHPVSLMPAMSFMFLGVMLSRLCMPFLPIDEQRYVRIAGFLSGAVLLLGIFLPSQLGLDICLLLTGLLFGSLLPCFLSIGCARMPEHTLVVTTTLMLSYYLGEALSSPLIGFLDSAFSLRAGIALCGICMLASSASYLMDKKPSA